MHINTIYLRYLIYICFSFFGWQSWERPAVPCNLYSAIGSPTWVRRRHRFRLLYRHRQLRLNTTNITSITNTRCEVRIEMNDGNRIWGEIDQRWNKKVMKEILGALSEKVSVWIVNLYTYYVFSKLMLLLHTFSCMLTKMRQNYYIFVYTKTLFMTILTVEVSFSFDDHRINELRYIPRSVLETKHPHNDSFRLDNIDQTTYSKL